MRENGKIPGSAGLLGLFKIAQKPPKKFGKCAVIWEERKARVLLAR